MKERASEEDISLGKQASLVLDDPAWKEAVADAEAGFLLDWRQGETVALREEAFHNIRALEAVVRNLKKFHERGVYVARTIAGAERLKGSTHNPAGWQNPLKEGIYHGRRTRQDHVTTGRSLG